MDISKLPKLSKTGESQPPPAASEIPDPVPASPAPLSRMPAPSPPMGLAEAWISIGLGILLLIIFPNTIKFISSPDAFQQNNPVTGPDGNTIPYLKSIFFLTDLGITVFAAALIVEGIVLAVSRKVGPIVFAFVVTVAAALFNVIVIIRSEQINGFPLVPGLGVLLLGYMVLTQWRIIAALCIKTPPQNNPNKKTSDAGRCVRGSGEGKNRLKLF